MLHGRRAEALDALNTVTRPAYAGRVAQRAVWPVAARAAGRLI